MKILRVLRAKSVKEEQLLRINRGEVRALNRKVLLVLSAVLLVAFLLLIIVALAVSSYRMMLVPYCIITVLLGIIFLLALTVKNAPPVFMLYMIGLTLFAYCIMTSCFVIPNEICVTVLGLIMMMPMFILDKSMRIDISLIGAAVLYIIMAVIFKDQYLIVDEVVNTVIALLIGIALGRFFRHARLENFELRRLGVLRETVDQLTGLYNRRKLFDTFKEAEKPGNNKHYRAAAMIDVDKFKMYNDTYGHQAGDDCLKEIGKCLRSISDEHAVTFYRYGGEEFVGLFERDRDLDPLSVCWELNGRVSRLRIGNKADEAGHVTVSIGLALIEDDSRREFEKWIYEADSAVYAAKEKGRNTTALYEDDGRQIKMSFRGR